MFKRLGEILLPVLLLLAEAPASTIQAKPPGLPVSQKDACLEKSPQQEIHSEPIVGEISLRIAKVSDDNAAKPGATIVFEFGIDSATGIFTGMAAGRASSMSQASLAEELGEGWNRLFGFRGGSSGFFGMEITAGLPLGEQPSSEPGRESSAHANDRRQNRTPSDCPYMQAQGMKLPPKAMTASVLDNLGKIETARKLYDQAEKERCAGHLDSACRNYEEVQRLCPGSRFDEQASAHLAELQPAKESESRRAQDEEEEDYFGNCWPKGIEMHCKVRLAGLNVTVNLKENGRGSLSIGYETLLGLAYDSALMSLFNFAP